MEAIPDKKLDLQNKLKQIHPSILWSFRNPAPRGHGMQRTCREDESQTLSNISSSEQGYSLSTTATAEITTRAIHSYTNVISYKQKNLSFHLKASKLCEVSSAVESLNNVNTVDHHCLISSSFFIFAPLIISSLLVSLLLFPSTMCLQFSIICYLLTTPCSNLFMVLCAHWKKATTPLGKLCCICPKESWGRKTTLLRS